MRRSEKILDLAKSNSVFVLRRKYDSVNNFSVAILVALILTFLEFLRAIIYMDLRLFLVVSLGFFMLSFLFAISQMRRIFYTLCLEIKETGLYKSKEKAINYLEDMLHAF